MNEERIPSAAASSVSDDALMIERGYLLKLQKYRLDGGPDLSSYVGTKWFFMKVVIAVLAVCIIVENGPQKYMGWLLVGYLIGTVSASLKSLMSLKRLWPIQDAITNWSIVSERLRHSEKG